MSQLPADPIEIEQIIISAIRDKLLTVPLIARYCQVHYRERFPTSDESDIRLSTVPDPANGDILMTSIMQIGLPIVRELPYTSEQCTQLRLEYPITWDLQATDEWNNADGTLVYTNSRSLLMAVYMQARGVFARNRTLGFQNCYHDYLQQESALTVVDEETGGRLHTVDWSLVAWIKGITL